MLRSGARLLLVQTGGACQAAAGGGAWGAVAAAAAVSAQPQLQQQGLGWAAAAASPAAAAWGRWGSGVNGGGGGAAQHRGFSGGPAAGGGGGGGADLDSMPAGELLTQADALVAATEAAVAAAVAAVQANSWAGTRAFVDLLLWTHDGLGMPWFEAITVSNLVIKVLMVPLAVAMQREAPKMQAVRAEAQKIQELSIQISKARSASEYEQLMVERRERSEALRGSSSLFKTLLMPALTVAQAVVLVSQFSAVSSLAGEKLPSMTHEGALWFLDLTVPDPYWGLPVMAAAATVGMLVGPGASASQLPGPSGRAMRTVGIVFALALIPIGGFYTSSAIAILWSGNAMFQLLQNVLLASPGVRRVLRMPDAAAAAAAAGGSQSWLERLGLGGGGEEDGRPDAVAPPPGTRPGGVNYLPNRPRRRPARPTGK